MKYIFVSVLKKYCYNNMDQGETSELKPYPDLKYYLYSLRFKDNILNSFSDLYWMYNKNKFICNYQIWKCIQ